MGRPKGSKNGQETLVRDAIFENDYVLIPLTQGQFTKVDCDDYNKFPILRQLWKALYMSKMKSYYAVKSIRENGEKEKILYMHRLIMGQTERKVKVDHIDYDTLNNRKYNLQVCTHADNIRRSRDNHERICLYKGVSRAGKKFRSRINYNGSAILIGHFSSEREAGLAYNRKAIELFGDYAVINEIND